MPKCELILCTGEHECRCVHLCALSYPKDSDDVRLRGVEIRSRARERRGGEGPIRDMLCGITAARGG